MNQPIEILIVDDDITFCEVLADSLIKSNYLPHVAHNGLDALALTEKFKPNLALIDLKMPNTSGLVLIPQLLKINPDMKIIVLTGYAAINTAVESIKLGAIHYLSKPITSKEIIAAFEQNEANPNLPINDEEILPLNEAEKAYILTALKRNNDNISATARELGMHRRTLQRKLDKMR